MLGVIFDMPGALLFVTMARKAAVFGLGGGNPLPVAPPKGVKPVLKLDKSGVNPLRKLLTSKVDCGPASIAGESGPDRRDPVKDELQGYCILFAS